jgi:hypothetical protein
VVVVVMVAAFFSANVNFDLLGVFVIGGIDAAAAAEPCKSVFEAFKDE